MLSCFLNFKTGRILKKSNCNPVLRQLTHVVLPFFLAGSLIGCKPEENFNGHRTADNNQHSEVQVTVGQATLDAIERIKSGDFQTAKDILDVKEEVPGVDDVHLLLQWHDQLTSHRLAQRQEAYEEQLAELRELEAELSEVDVPDANSIDTAMMAVLLARDYAPDDDQAAALLDYPFVQRLVELATGRAEDYRQAGEWMKAYAHGYYWLSNLFEEDPHYEEIAERLTELATIELALRESGCGESAQERHEGIQPEMLLRALSALEVNYVNSLDYPFMAEKALLRCELLGEVLLRSPEELAWHADPEAAESWQAGIAAIQTEIASADDDADKQMRGDHFVRIFDEILALNAVSVKLPQEVIVAHFSEAALAALDPYTSLVWPWQVQDFEKSMTQQFTGIGVEITNRGGVLKITSLLPDTPAYRSGLDAEDEILAVNGESTAEMTITCAVSKITGPRGTEVTLTMRRPVNNETWDVTIKRDRIVVQPLRGWRRTRDGQWEHIVDPVNRIGYVRMTSFTESSEPDLRKILRDLERDGLNGLILDLRFNSGGYLSSASDVVNLFIREGVIVKSNPRHGLATYEIARRSGTHPDYPLVILINGGSASASEIVAGALQDPLHRRAVLVGERTFGKGSVQVVTPVTGGGSQLKYTVAYYHLPSDQQVKSRYLMKRAGRTDWGIAPDVEIEMSGNEVRKMLDMQRQNDVLFRADHSEDGEEPMRHSLEDTLRADPQLATALMVAQAKLIARGHEVNLDLFEDKAGEPIVATDEDF